MSYKSVFFCAIFFIANNVYAGATQGKVTAIFVHGFNDVVAFHVESTAPSYTGCAVSQRYAVSTSTQQGKNILSTVLAAKAAGQNIQVVGMNTCNANGDAEDINYIVVL